MFPGIHDFFFFLMGHVPGNVSFFLMGYVPGNVSRVISVLCFFIQLDFCEVVFWIEFGGSNSWHAVLLVDSGRRAVGIQQSLVLDCTFL